MLNDIKISELLQHLEEPGVKILHISYDDRKTTLLSKDGFRNLWRIADDSMEHCLQSALSNYPDLNEEFFIVTARGNLIKIG